VGAGGGGGGARHASPRHRLFEMHKIKIKLKLFEYT